MKVLILILSIICLPNNEGKGRRVQEYFTKGECEYSVYSVFGSPSTINCNDWEYEGRVSNGNSVSIAINAGEEIQIRIVHGSYNVCDGRKQKRQDRISVPSNFSQEHKNRIELADFNCP